MKIIKSLLLVIAVAIFSVVTFASTSEAATPQLSTMTINVDGVKKKESIILQDGRAYLPLRSLTERFPGATISYNNTSKQISVKLNTYRPTSKFIISPLAPAGKAYISEVNLDSATNKAKPVLSTFGDNKPILHNDTTYLSIRDLGKLFDAEIEWDKATNTIHVLYKGIDKVVDEKWSISYTDYRNAARYVDLVNYVYEESYLPTYNYYENLTIIFKVTSKLPIGGYKNTFSAMAKLSDNWMMNPYNAEMTMLMDFYLDQKYYRGVKASSNGLFYTSVVPQTINDIK